MGLMPPGSEPCEICERLQRELSLLKERHREALQDLERRATTPDTIAWQRARTAENEAIIEVRLAEYQLEQHRRTHSQERECQAGGL